MLKASSISYRIHHLTLLHETELQFEAGKFHVIMGANGAGKSTLMKLLAGSQKVSSGKVWLESKELDQYGKKELAIKRGVLSQHYHIGFPITAYDVVMMGRYPHYKITPSQDDHLVCEKAMELMEVGEMRERDYNTLSAGEAQKVQMSRVLAQIWNANEKEHKILFLDEPVSHLDIKYQHQLLGVAKEHCRHFVTVIAILHDINLAMNYGDRILFMKQGKILYETGKREEVTTTIIQDIFDVQSRIIDQGDGKPPVVVF